MNVNGGLWEVKSVGGKWYKRVWEVKRFKVYYIYLYTKLTKYCLKHRAGGREAKGI
jgi:hypothetical protein